MLDSTFEGNWAIEFGLDAVNPNGLVARRLEFSAFTNGGLRASDNLSTSYGGSTAVINSISDISVNGVSESTPGASGGTGEAGLWIGQPVTHGVHRIAIKNVSISGIETVNNAWNTTFSDLNIDMSGPDESTGVGVYLEHFSRNLVFTHFSIRGARHGFNAEWDDGVGGNGAAHDVTIENGVIDAAGTTTSGKQVGVYLDQGTAATRVTDVTFESQNGAGIVAFENIGRKEFAGNTYRLSRGAVRLSTNHL